MQTLQSLQYLKGLPGADKNQLKKKQVTFPPYKPQQHKKTVIFDLDETLVHCIDDINSKSYQVPISVIFPNGETVKAGINIRPFALECLRKVSEKFQVVVFTASHQSYADEVLDKLDPKRELIAKRLYRDHCLQTAEGIYIKDLRIIKNRTLKEVVIVDNAVYSFGYQLDNGIPIIPYYDNPKDEELLHLIHYLDCLENSKDMRE